MTSNLALNLAEFAGENPAKGYLTTENTDLSASRTDLIEVASTGGGNQSIKRWNAENSRYTVMDQYGLLVDWYGATADSGTASMTGENASDSLCPRRWTLPTDSENGSYDNLLVGNYIPYFAVGSVGSWRIRKAPLGFVYGGYVRRDNAMIGQTVNGNYWTSHSGSSGSAAMRLAFDGGTIKNDEYDKTYQLEIRCVYSNQ